MIKPLGYFVLIEMEKVEKTSAGGIIMPDELTNKEQEATSVGWVRDIGPTAYVGYPGCDEKPIDTEPYKMQPHESWGIKIGMKVEYKRFDGNRSNVPGHENYRFIPDSNIYGGIDDE